MRRSFAAVVNDVFVSCPHMPRLDKPGTTAPPPRKHFIYFYLGERDSWMLSSLQKCVLR